MCFDPRRTSQSLTRGRARGGRWIGFNVSMRGRCGILLLAVVLAACGEDDLAVAPASTGTVPGVGVLPEALSRAPHLEVTTTTSSTVPRPTVTIDRAELRRSVSASKATACS